MISRQIAPCFLWIDQFTHSATGKYRLESSGKSTVYHGQYADTECDDHQTTEGPKIHDWTTTN